MCNFTLEKQTSTFVSAVCECLEGGGGCHVTDISFKRSTFTDISVAVLFT